MDKFEWVELLCLLPEKERVRAEYYLVRGWDHRWVFVNAVENRVVECAAHSGSRGYEYLDICGVADMAMTGDFTALKAIMYDLDMGD